MESDEPDGILCLPLVSCIILGKLLHHVLVPPMVVIIVLTLQGHWDYEMRQSIPSHHYTACYRICAQQMFTGINLIAITSPTELVSL